jgi:uncharacterized protein
MRLAIAEQSAISDTIRQADADATIYLDLLVLSTKITLMTKLDILAELHQKLGERKIDIAIYPDATRPFPRIIMQEGVRL